MNESDEIKVSKRQKAAGNICAGAAVILCGFFLLLCGVDVIPLYVPDVLAASILLAVAFAFLSSGMIQKNAVSVWIGVAFILPALVEILVKYAHVRYDALYPLYIAIPAVASCATGLIWRNFKPHYAAIIFFGGLAALFTLQSSGLTGWEVAAPAVLLFIGACITFVAVRSYRKKDADEVPADQEPEKPEEAEPPQDGK